MNEKEIAGILAIITTLLKDDKKKGYVLFGMLNDENRLEAGASIKELSIGDVAVSAASLIAKASQNAPQKK